MGGISVCITITEKHHEQDQYLRLFVAGNCPFAFMSLPGVMNGRYCAKLKGHTCKERTTRAVMRFELTPTAMVIVVSCKLFTSCDFPEA